MRGVQLGRAIGARCVTKPAASDWAWADVVVLVKRAAMVYAKDARQVDCPVVWDALDFWQQPEQNGTPRAELIAQAKRIAEDAYVDLIIGATRQMADDLGGVYLPHHCLTGLQPVPVRSQAQVVAYHGTPKYLGKWKPMLEKACEAMGLRFVVNPDTLRDVDALVSFRDGRWDGDVCREWKSGVKIVNAIVAGRPMLCQPCAGQRELAPIGLTIDAPVELIDALAVLVSPDVRAGAYEYGRRVHGDYHFEAVARDYRALLDRVVQRRAA